MSLVGVHVSNILDILKQEYENINFFQFFVSTSIDYKKKEYEKVLNYIRKNNIYMLVHGAYSINMSRRWNEADWWIQQLIAEIVVCEIIGCFGIVIHTGKQLELSNNEALNNMYTSLLYIHEQTKKQQNVKIILETPSGQGTETLTKINEMCKFMSKFYKHPDVHIKSRFGICIDSCHIFAAGHDIRTSEDMNNFFGIINNMVGIDKIKVCHINDSKKGLGLKLDRHMNIGKGKIGNDPIIRIVKFMKELEIPIILETPNKPNKSNNAIIEDYKKIK